MSSHTVPTVVPSGNVAVAAPPSGWYPDPRGSDQLRWWDGSAWTRQLAPRPASAIVAVEPPAVVAAAVAPAAETPTAVEPRDVVPNSLEPIDVAAAAVATTSVAATAVTTPAVEPAVLEPGAAVPIEPAAVVAAAVEPSAVEPPADAPTALDIGAVEATAAQSPVPDRVTENTARPSAASSEAPVDGPGYDWQRETERHAPIPSVTPRVEQWDVRDVPRHSGTTAVWLLAFTPYLSLPLLAAAEVFVRGTSLDGGNAAGLFAALTLYALVFVLATRDNTVLARRGHRRRAQPSWALLGALPYLIARTVNVRRETGVGTAPLWLWVVNLLCAAVLLYTAVTVAGQIRDLDLLGGML